MWDNLNLNASALRCAFFSHLRICHVCREYRPLVGVVLQHSRVVGDVFAVGDVSLGEQALAPGGDVLIEDSSFRAAAAIDFLFKSRVKVTTE